MKKLPLSEPLKISMDVLLAVLEQLWAHQTTLRASLRELCRKERYRKAFEIARGLPGIGWYTAIRLILELGEDLSRFTSGEKIAAFVGLTPGEHSTGETTWKGRITGMGSGFIRATLIENSWVAIRKDAVLLASSCGYGREPAVRRRRLWQWPGCSLCVLGRASFPVRLT